MRLLLAMRRSELRYAARVNRQSMYYLLIETVVVKHVRNSRSQRVLDSGYYYLNYEQSMRFAVFEFLGLTRA